MERVLRALHRRGLELSTCCVQSLPESAVCGQEVPEVGITVDLDLGDEGKVSPGRLKALSTLVVTEKMKIELALDETKGQWDVCGPQTVSLAEAFERSSVFPQLRSHNTTIVPGFDIVRIIVYGHIETLECL